MFSTHFFLIVVALWVISSFIHIFVDDNCFYHLFYGADFLISAAVAEFKGPDIFGVVRLAQVNMGLARIEASFSGLSPGKRGWSINEFGDLTRGAASTGKVFNPPMDGLDQVYPFDIHSLILMLTPKSCSIYIMKMANFSG